MVRIDRVVTRGGDGGETSLGDGTRVRKDSRRVEAIGAVDEANAAIGVLRLHTQALADSDAMLARIQNDLFDVGADLCVPGEGGERLRVTDAPVLRLQAEVAAMNEALPPLTSFILPGGSAGAAYAHVARTVVRRAERLLVSSPIEGSLVHAYLNRLSDLLWAMARWAEGPDPLLARGVPRRSAAPTDARAPD